MSSDEKITYGIRIKKLVENNQGDLSRLQHIAIMIRDEKPLYESDKKYVNQLYDELKLSDNTEYDNQSPEIEIIPPLKLEERKHWRFKCKYIEGISKFSNEIEGELFLIPSKQESEIIFEGRDGNRISIPMVNFVNVEPVKIETGNLLKKTNLMIKIEFVDHDGNIQNPIFDVKDKQMAEIGRRFTKLKDEIRDSAIVYFKSNNKILKTKIDGKSPQIQDNEEKLWINEFTRGVFRKKVSVIQVITNFRIFTYDIENDLLLALLFIDSIDDVIVENRRRRSSSDRVGVFTGRYGKGKYGGVSYSHSESISRSIGDLRFMKEGQTYMTFRGVTDPSAVQRLVKSVKKQMYPKKEITAFIEAEEEQKKPLQIIEKHSFCENCKTDNPDNSKFCHNCGNKLIPSCQNCKKINPKGASFCGGCGNPLE